MALHVFHRSRRVSRDVGERMGSAAGLALCVKDSQGTLIGRATTFFFDTWPLILSPLRVVPKQSTTPALFVEAPFWFIGWSVLGGAALLLVSRRSRPLLRSWLMWTALLAAVLGLIMAKPLWSAMPRPLVFIQFPYRLSAYVAFSVAALTGTTLLMVQRENGSERSRSLAFLKVSLDLVVALSLASCVWQLWVPDTASVPRFMPTELLRLHRRRMFPLVVRESAIRRSK